MAEQANERRASVSGFVGVHVAFEAGYLAAEARKPASYDHEQAYFTGLHDEGWGDVDWLEQFMAGWQAWCAEAGIVEASPDATA